MLKIAMVASGLIVILVVTGLYNISIDQSVECAEMSNDLYQRGLAFNDSAKNYQYRANDLDGQHDLQGDILAWKNHLLNEYTLLQYEAKRLENKCGPSINT